MFDKQIRMVPRDIVPLYKEWCLFLLLEKKGIEEDVVKRNIRTVKDRCFS